MITDIYVEDDRHLRVAMVLEMERKMERLKNKNILITGGTRGIVWLLLRNSNVKVLVSQFAARTRRG